MLVNVRKPKRVVEGIEEPPVAQALFGEVRWAWIWLILRLYLRYEWLQAGLGKLGNPAWTGENASAAVTGFVNGALQKTAESTRTCRPGMPGSWSTWCCPTPSSRATWSLGERSSSLWAWRTSGWWGLDRWILPALGTPWRPGLIFKEDGGGQQMVQRPGDA